MSCLVDIPDGGSPDCVDKDKVEVILNLSEMSKSGAYASGDGNIRFVDVFAFSTSGAYKDFVLRNCTDLSNVRLEVTKGLKLHIFVIANYSMPKEMEDDAMSFMVHPIPFDSNEPDPVMIGVLPGVIYTDDVSINEVCLDRVISSLSVGEIDFTGAMEESGHNYKVRMFIANSNDVIGVRKFWAPSSSYNYGSYLLSVDSDPSLLTGFSAKALTSCRAEDTGGWISIPSSGSHSFASLGAKQIFFFYPNPAWCFDDIYLVIEYTREDESYTVRYPVLLSGLLSNKRYVINRILVTTEHPGETSIDFTVSVEYPELEIVNIIF